MTTNIYRCIRILRNKVILTFKIVKLICTRYNVICFSKLEQSVNRLRSLGTPKMTTKVIEK